MPKTCDKYAILTIVRHDDGCTETGLVSSANLTTPRSVESKLAANLWHAFDGGSKRLLTHTTGLDVQAETLRQKQERKKPR